MPARLVSDDSASQYEAIEKGWKLDVDGWWTRPLRAEDREIADPSVGFLNRTDNHDGSAGPYVRTAVQALAYDAEDR